MSKKLSLLQEAGYVASAFLRQEILALLQENAARSSSSPLSVISLPREPRSHSPAAARQRSLALSGPRAPSPSSRRDLLPIPVAAHCLPLFPALPRQNGNP